MNPERWKRIEELYATARELLPDARPRFLEDECRGDIELKLEIERMLAAHDTSSDFVEPPSTDGSRPDESQDFAGQSFGDFELLERIGRGGMGAVYRARQRSLGREVALKVLPSVPFAHSQRRARFEREARSVARLRHRGIVTVYSVGVHEEVPYFAMELVRGHDLADEIARLRRHTDGPPPSLPPFESRGYFAAVARAVADVADALQHAHESGIVHRDIKPSNLLVDGDSKLRVVDFGLARDEALGSITATSEHGGTPHYMSPEQIRAGIHRVDQRTDVYSLGVVLYELLTLTKPFDGHTSSEIFEQIVGRDPVPLRRANPRVPRDLAVICATAMARDLGDRYSSAAALRDDLNRVLDHEAIVARPPSLGRRLRSFARRHRTALIGAACVLVAALAGGFVQSVRATERAAKELAERWQRVVDLPDWDSAIDEVAIAYREWRASRAIDERLSAPLAEVARALGERLDRDRAARVRRGRELLEHGFGSAAASESLGGNRAPASDRALAEALLIFNVARSIYSDDPEIASLAEPTTVFPRVGLRLSALTSSAFPANAAVRVVLHAIDPLIGTEDAEPRTLVETVLGNVRAGVLLEDAPMVPGNWRFSVAIGDSFAETTRSLSARKDPYEIVVRVRPTVEVLVGMKLIPAGRFAFDRERPMACDVGGPTADHAAFWIDEAEVSNGEYIAFLRDSGHPAPQRWRALGYIDDWRALPLGDAATLFLDLPVAGIDCEDAQAYAEWAGKRLPTHVELERALRGTNGARLPWGSGARNDSGGACNIDGTSALEPRDQRSVFESYLNNVRAVRDGRFRQAPEGLFHAHGNVAEYTESMVAEPQHGVLVTMPWERLYLGSAWDAAVWNHTLASHSITGVGPRHAKDFVGIRCARSDKP